MEYQILRFWNLSLHHCGCDTIANFFSEIGSLDLAWWVATWPDVIWIQSFHKRREKDVKMDFVLRYREKPRKKGKIKHPE